MINVGDYWAEKHLKSNYLRLSLQRIRSILINRFNQAVISKT